MNKKLKVALIVTVCAVLFYVFGIGLSTKGDASSTKRIIRNNTLYTQSEIYSAMKATEKEFESDSQFRGAVLKKVIYDGKDGYSFAKNKKEYGYEKVVHFSTYIVGAPIWQSGLFVNKYHFYSADIYFEYVLAQIDNGTWKVIDGGYF